MTPWEKYKKKQILEKTPPGSIFVCIPSFQEEDLFETVEDCFNKASDPEKIFIGICNQKIDNNFVDFSTFKNVKTVNITSSFLLGLGLCFTIAMSLYDYQDYFLRIDSHTRFEKNWDLILIKNFNIIKNDGYEKPIISYRSPWFTKDIDKNLDFKDWKNPDINSQKNELIYESLTTKIPLKKPEDNQTNSWENISYKEHYFISGHFIFSSGSFVKDIFADARVIFYGEEHTMPVRAYTRGYRIFAIKEQSIWTMGKTPEYINEYYPDNWKNRKNIKSTFLENNFKNHYKSILKGEEFGFYGAKDKETYEEYIKAMGVDYREIL